ncbi:hypothetical protein RJT34_19823 [Clitoria ternatea]|uniref:Uncharacterized protein n=1 Tax=Clitoria ternatea TaxID=43366 RepID=A0AAN9P485_CLITE
MLQLLTCVFEGVWWRGRVAMKGFNPSKMSNSIRTMPLKPSKMKRVPKRVWLSFQKSMGVLVGGNHTSSRFCTR